MGIPHFSPRAYLRRLASATTAPAGVDAMCVTCMSWSLGDESSVLPWEEPFLPPAAKPRK